jgi:hypothetical protein
MILGVDSERFNMDRIWYNETGITCIYKDWPTPKTENFFSFDEGYSDSDSWVDTDLPDHEQAAFIASLIAGETTREEREHAQSEVDKRLAKTLYDLTDFIKKKFILNQSQIDQVSAMTTVPQLRAVILERFSLTQGQQDYIEDFRDAYELWLSKQ